MKKIFIQTPFPDETSFNGYLLSHLSYQKFFKNRRKPLDIIKNGYSGSSLFWKFRNPESMQKLYLEKDKEYFSFLYAFREKYSNYDAIVMNPGVDLVHPEFLIKNFPNSIKCLHFVDDPHASYSYGFPYAWAFDAATYISPSFNRDFSMDKILKLVGFSNIKWFPLSISNLEDPKYDQEDLANQISQRNNKAVYVGNFYREKNKRLTTLKRLLGKDLDIFGRYPLNGHYFSIDSLLNLTPNFYRVKSLSDMQREKVYEDYSIGLNMHLSSPSLETGNARLYEVAYRGLAQVCDTSEFSSVANIFQPEKEILLYSNIDECVEQINRLQSDHNLLKDIALAGYKKATEAYNYNDNLMSTLDWLASLNDKSIGNE